MDEEKKSEASAEEPERLGPYVLQEQVIYSGTPHAFFNDTRGNYRPMASRDAWARTLTFFTAHLG